MPRGHIIGTEAEGGFQKNIKFDLPVAEHIRIGRPARGVFGKHIVHDAGFVVGAHVDHLKGDAEFLGHEQGIVAVFDPRTFIGEYHRLIVPVFHKQTDHIVSLLFEQVRHHTRIHSA